MKKGACERCMSSRGHEFYDSSVIYVLCDDCYLTHIYDPSDNWQFRLQTFRLLSPVMVDDRMEFSTDSLRN